ncbi:MAG: rod shape-determining protein RodA [candidate division NC10 bacterium]|nr:rod shape-determining protein RodA [candidate division NC10 bacterium]
MPLDRRLIQNFEWRIILAAFLLAGLGILSIYTATATASLSLKQHLYLRQATWFVVGAMLLLAVVTINYRTTGRFAYLFYGLAIFSLLLVPFFGRVGLGAQRWIKLGFLAFQPSEVAKVALVLCLARYFEDRKERVTAPRTMGGAALLTLVPALLVVRQPDLGTALILLAVGVSLMLLVGVRLRVLVPVGVGLLALAPIVWTFLKAYQKRRLLVFLNPNLDPLGAGYHVAQSKIAVGSGELLGKGFMAASQSQLNFLPENHTDFIFAVLAEQWGFLGSLAVLVLFYFLIIRGLEISMEAKDLFGSLMAFGITTMIGLQALLNIGMVLGVMPVVGIPLPLVSYGGSSMVMTLTAIGLLVNVRMRRFMY